MDQVVAKHEDRQIHVVLDNLSTHSGSDVDKWLAKHPNVTFHFTPTDSSWLNQVEISFGIITKQAIRRGSVHITTPAHQHHQYIYHTLKP